jgi:ADP-ribose pyrophosphatase
MSVMPQKALLAAGLRPVSSWEPDGVAESSDWELNPSVQRPREPLKPAAVLIPLLPSARDEAMQVILTRRSDSLHSHSGQIAFPGGRLEPGETAVEAALREANEEINLDPARVEVLGLGDPYQTGSNFLITPVVGWLSSLPELTPSPDEVAEIFTVPWGFLMDPANHQRGTIEWEGAARQFWAMPWQDRYIWGATAGVLRALSQRLGPATSEG